MKQQEFIEKYAPLMPIHQVEAFLRDFVEVIAQTEADMIDTARAALKKKTENLKG